MFERYTEKARRTIFFARYEASQFGSPYIETEHLLLGLLREDKTLTNRFLRGHTSVESIRKQIAECTTLREKTSTSVDLPLSNDCKRALAYAAEEAEHLSHDHIGTEHLLLGLLREENCFAAKMLEERGVQLLLIREELQRNPHGDAPRGEIPTRTDVSRDLKTSLLFAYGELTANFLKVSCEKLEKITDQLRTCMSKLTDAQVWERHGVHENAVGNLVLHLCGNARQWVIGGVGGAADVRTRDEEFSADGGQTGAALMAIFEKMMAEVRDVIASVPAERLTEIIHPQGRTVTVLEAIYQVVAHVHQHVGQIILLTKQMTGKDLNLTIPRPR